MNNEGKNLETIALHAGWRADATTGSVAVPIHQTTSYQFESTEKAADLFALAELGNIKKDMPNGELKSLVEDVKDLKEDMSDLKYTLLNPEDGVIVKTNQNTLYRKLLEGNQKEFDSKMLELESMKRWKEGVNKALWILFSGLAAVIIKLLTEILNS